MKRIGLFGFIILLFLSCAGCYSGITCSVIDAESQQPIEGAVVMVEWTKTHGYGLTSTESFKVVEVISDQSGLIKLPGISDPFVNFPHVTVYKKGYVAWNDQFIFPPGYKPRTDFLWKDGFVFRLEQFKPEYLYDEHASFIRKAIRTGLIEQKSNILNASRWEEDIAFKERQIKRSK